MDVRTHTILKFSTQKSKKKRGLEAFQHSFLKALAVELRVISPSIS
jgi:hypothetical protein